MGSEFEASATEPTQVFLVVKITASETKFKVEVGGVALPEIVGPKINLTESRIPVTFDVAPGVKWKVKSVSGTISSMESSYIGI